MGKTQKKFDNMDEPLPRPDPVHDRPSHPVDPATVKVGDYMSMHINLQVKEVGPEGLVVEDLDNGGTFNIDGADMIKTLKSASYHAEDVRLSLSDMVRILITSFGLPFTAAYVKKDGQEREMKAINIHNEELFGRSLVRDLELPKDEKQSNLRLVDHRTMSSLVVDGVRYLIR
jgi:hypothetical protein